VDDLVQLLQLAVVGEHDAPQGTAVELSVGAQYRRAPSLDDLSVSGGADFDRATRQDVGIDNRGPALRKHLSYGGLAAADIAGESNEEHGV
jgi:hypothetical protein